VNDRISDRPIRFFGVNSWLEDLLSNIGFPLTAFLGSRLLLEIIAGNYRVVQSLKEASLADFQ